MTIRFPIRRILFYASAMAVVCIPFILARGWYHSDRHEATAVLSQVTRISNLQLHSHVDVTEEINDISFSVDGQPDSIVRIAGLGRYESESSFSLSQIGKWTFRVSGRRHNGVYKAATGQPVESDYFGGSIELGAGSPYQQLFPFEVASLQDVVDHYEEFVSLLETWPRENEPGQVTLDDGTTQFFYVSERIL